MGYIRDWMGPSRPTMEDLAMEYVLLGLTLDPLETLQDREHKRWDILQHMQGRCGLEHTMTFIKNATETLKMVTG